MTPLMILHVVTGTLAVLAGTTAILAPKGRPVHRAAGKTFVATMVVSAAAGAVIAAQKPEMITLLAGIFTCYLALTAIATVARTGKQAGWIEAAALLAASGIAAAAGLSALDAIQSLDGLKHGYSADAYLFFALLALLAAIGDASVLIRRGLEGRQRLARHLWRMSFALFIAVGSLFTGPGAQVFPEPLRGSPLLSVPEMIVILLLAMWLARVLLTKWALGNPAHRAAPVSDQP